MLHEKQAIKALQQCAKIVTIKKFTMEHKTIKLEQKAWKQIEPS